MSNELIEYGFEAPVKVEENVLSNVEESRAVAEVQASYVIAKKFPRNEAEAFTKIMRACERPFLAEQALYAYPRGGKLVEGPSIRLAEEMLRSWTNCDAVVRELSQNNGVSLMESYAIDYETNTRFSKTFNVQHVRDTKQGSKRLTDQRDIYEISANMAARRLRACILAIIPGDIVDAAVERCKKTMVEGITKGKEPMVDRIRKLVLAFDEIGVKVEHLEKRIGHKLDAIVPQELVSLGSIFKSIRDGMADRTDFFDIGSAEGANKKMDDLLASKTKPKLENEVDGKTGEVKSKKMDA